VTNATGRGGARRGASTVGFVVQNRERGRQAGAAWSAELAEYLDLKRLAEIAERGGFDDERAGYRVVSAIRGERYLSGEEIEAFREIFGFDNVDAETHSREYWLGFVQSALEAFDEVEI
jgi:hypothetical protein